MFSAYPTDSILGHRVWIDRLPAHLRGALVPIDDEENEGYFDGTDEYIDRDDEENEDDEAGDDSIDDVEEDEEDEDELR